MTFGANGLSRVLATIMRLYLNCVESAGHGTRHKYYTTLAHDSLKPILSAELRLSLKSWPNIVGCCEPRVACRSPDPGLTL